MKLTYKAHWHDWLVNITDNYCKAHWHDWLVNITDNYCKAHYMA